MPATTPENAPSEPPRLLVALLIIFAGLFVYAPVFHGDWLWDDDSEITEHAALHTLPGLLDIWAAKGSPDYLPVKSTVQWVFYRFAGQNPTAWHLLTISLHLVSAILLWKLFARLGIPYAWIGGLLWAIHPFAVCSVAWISELKNTLSLPFYLLAFSRFIDFYERGKFRDWWLAIGFFLVALLTKSSVVMLPCALLLFVWWKRAGGDAGVFEGLASGEARFSRLLSRLPARLRFWSIAACLVAPFFLASLAGGLTTIYFQHSRAIGGESMEFLGGIGSRIVLSGQAAWFYLYKSILPFGLLPNYPRWNILQPSIFQMLAWPAMLVLFIIFWKFRQSWGRHAIFWAGFVLINLVPVLGFVRMSYMRITWVSDHLAYISLVGSIGIVTALCGYIYRQSTPELRPFFSGIGALLLFVLALSAHNYSGVFQNEETMWKYTLRQNPEAWQAHSRLAKQLANRGLHGPAAFHVEQSAKLRPDLPETHNNIAGVLMSRGDTEAAIERYKKAVELAPEADMFKMNLANALMRANRMIEAEELMQILLDKYPNNPTLLNNFGGMLYYQGRYTEAIRYLKQALQANPNLQQAAANIETIMKAQQTRRDTPSPSSGEMSLLDSEVSLRLSTPR